MSDLLQAARTDAVHPFFVLLYLLKGHADPIGKGALAEIQHQASHAHTAADMLVDQGGRFLPRLLRGPDRLFLVPSETVYLSLRTLNALTGWLKPFRISSPTGSTSLSASTDVCTFASTRI